MGIKDLLKLLSPAIQDSHLSHFSGKSVAIDASSWLHKALFASAEDLIDNNFWDSQLYVDFVLIRLNDLRVHGIQPVMVFDGQRASLKAETNIKRQELRQLQIENGKKLLENMKYTVDKMCYAKLRQEAIACFQRGLSVTPEMERNLIAALRKLNIPVIVAPSEADSQLAYLCLTNNCQAVMTEDSDILVYSAVCGVSFPILYKYDRQRESVQCIELGNVINFDERGNIEKEEEEEERGEERGEDSNSVEECSPFDDADNENNSSNSNSNNRNNSSSQVGKKRKDRSERGGGGKESFLPLLKEHFHGVNGRRMFVQLCILAGCDYSESLHGVGLITAVQAMLQCKDNLNNLRLQAVCKYFAAQKKDVTDAYLARVLKSEQQFYYALVYNPITKCIVPFSAIPELDVMKQYILCISERSSNRPLISSTITACNTSYESSSSQGSLSQSNRSNKRSKISVTSGSVSEVTVSITRQNSISTLTPLEIDADRFPLLYLTIVPGQLLGRIEHLRSAVQVRDVLIILRQTQQTQFNRVFISTLLRRGVLSI